MDIRWVIDDHEDGRIVSLLLSNGHPMLYRELWMHDCVELNRQERTALYREQLEVVSDDPLAWTARPLPLRRSSGRWQTCIDVQEWSRWLEAQKDRIKNRREFAERFPGRAFDDGIEAADRRLAQLQTIGHGWIDLAEDVSAALDSELGEEVEK
jgi:hypothetical protein